MRCFEKLMSYLIVVAVLTMSSSAFAAFNWGDACAPGSDNFQQDIQKSAKVEVGVIPAGKANVLVYLTSPVDVDMHLEDVESGTQIVNWQGGLLNGAGQACATYEGAEYCYSGYAGDGNGPGYEFIKINGTSNRPVKMFAYGYQAGAATVDYSWDAPANCVDAGSGSFDQVMAQNDLAVVGVIPAGKEKVEVTLEADADLDIEIYHGDKVIVAYGCMGKTPHFDNCLNSGSEASVVYEGMTITYSGWNGVDGKAGNEFVKIDGTLTQPLTVKAFAYQAGTAKVTYSWGADAGTPDAGTPVADAPVVDAPAVDPTSYCGPSNVAWDSGINMCVVDPAFTAAKEQCETDLSAANSAKATCDSAKAMCDSDLSAANSAKATCDSAKATCDTDLSTEKSVTLACLSREAICLSNLSAATDAKSACESAKNTVESDLATCHVDLTDAQATKSASGIDNQCVVLAAPSHGTIVFTDSGLNSTQSFACDMGYQPVGSTAISCGQKSHDDTSVVFGWNGTAPLCIQVCSEPQVPADGTLVKSNDNFEASVITYTCLPGNILVGDTSQQCLSGQWSGSAPTCQKDLDWSDVTIWTYSEAKTMYSSSQYGAYTDVYALTNQHGNEILVLKKYNKISAGYHVKVPGGLKGRIALRNLPATTAFLDLTGGDQSNPNEITQIVEITGMQMNHSMPHSWYSGQYNISLGDAQEKCSKKYIDNVLTTVCAVHNPNYVHTCPLGTEEVVSYKSVSYDYANLPYHSSMCTLLPN